jgi:hypothetical protein
MGRVVRQGLEAAEEEGPQEVNPMKRFVIRMNYECGDPIIELRDVGQPQNNVLIAEFYPPVFPNARYEAAKLVAQLNGDPSPSPDSFTNDERLDAVERRLAELEKYLAEKYKLYWNQVTQPEK